MQYNYIGKYITIVLCLLTVGLVSASYAQLIRSDWQPDNEEKPVVSVIDLATFDEKAAKFEQEKKAEAKQMAEDIEVVKEKRTILMECLNEKEVTLFTMESKDCKECTLQRQFFADDMKKLTNYINCETNKITCPLRGIKAYPTWYLGPRIGLRKEGVLDLETLAKLTDCPW